MKKKVLQFIHGMTMGGAETLIKELVNDPEEVSVKEFESEDENNIIIEVLVSEKELGKIIGRNGKTGYQNDCFCSTGFGCCKSENFIWNQVAI